MALISVCSCFGFLVVICTFLGMVEIHVTTIAMFIRHAECLCKAGPASSVLRCFIRRMQIRTVKETRDKLLISLTASANVSVQTQRVANFVGHILKPGALGAVNERSHMHSFTLERS